MHACKQTEESLPLLTILISDIVERLSELVESVAVWRANIVEEVESSNDSLYDISSNIAAFSRSRLLCRGSLIWLLETLFARAYRE